MSDSVSISTTVQGSGSVAAKAQAGGKGTGFLGMLMAAIGHKGVAEAGAKANKATQQASPDHATGQDEKGKAKDALIGKMAEATQGKAQTAAVQATMDETSLKRAKAKAMDALIGKMAEATQGKAQTASQSTAGDTSLKHAKAKAMDALIGKMAEATQGKAQTASQSTAGDTSLKHAKTDAKDTAMKAIDPKQALANADAAKDMKTTTKNDPKSTHKQHDTQDAQTQTGNASGPMSGISAAMLHTATPLAPAHRQKSGNGQAVTEAVADAIGERVQTPDHTAKPAHGMGPAANPGIDKSATASEMPADASKHQATTDASLITPKPQATHVAAEASSGHVTQVAGEAGIADTEAQPQAQPSAKGHTKGAKGQAAAGQTAKAAALGTSTIAQTHPQDAMAANSHAGSPDTSGPAATHASPPQTGVRSYAQIAHGHARQLPLQATLTGHAAPAPGPRADMPTGSSPAAGQDASAANMALTANAGIGANTQAASNPQPAMPQAPVHASGPWTAMAAMTEISQAAANGQTRLELKLEPAHLGKVHVRIDSDSHKNIQVHLVVEQPNSRQFIEQQLPNLRHAMEQQGLNLGNFSMSSQQQGSGQDTSGQSGQQAPSIPTAGIQATAPSAPQLSHAPAESLGSGRLSIRI